MPKHVQDKLSFDTRLMEIYLTGIQSEVEAKLRRVAKFREQMRKIDAMGGRTDRQARQHVGRALTKQVEVMLETNAEVRDTLEELLKAAKAVLADLERPEI